MPKTQTYLTRRQVEDALADWIDSAVIAELLVESIKEELGELDLQACKNLWLATLEELPGLLLDIAHSILS